MNRVALGTQSVTVFKDARELGRSAAEIAVQLAESKKLSEIQGAKPWNLGPKKLNMTALFLTPVAITKDNLDVVINAGWAPKDVVCQGVKAGSVKACN